MNHRSDLVYPQLKRRSDVSPDTATVDLEAPPIFPNSQLATRVFLCAGVYGLLVLFPLYFVEQRLGRIFPPAITHPENFYGFIGIALAWQLVFLTISRDPSRFRPVMLPAVAEKLLSALPCFVLYADSRVPGVTVLFAAVDLALGALFLIAYVQTKSSASQDTHGGPEGREVKLRSN